MNIGIDIRSLQEVYRTGVGEFTYEWLTSLFKTDTENQFFLLYGGRKADHEKIQFWKQKNVHYIYVGWPSKILNLLSILGFIKLDTFMMKMSKISNKENNKIEYFLSPNIGFARVSRECKQILVVHDLSFELYPYHYSWKRRMWHAIIFPKKQCQRSSIIITPSENTKRDVEEYFSIEKSKVVCILPGISESYQQSVESLGNHTLQYVKKKYHLPERYMLFLGTIEPRKNIEGIIEAFVLFKQHTKSDHRLVIAGSLGWKYKKILKKIEQTTDVMYIGYVASEDKAALFTLAEVFLYPSFCEGFGFPVLEAQAVGVPVVTSNRSSLVEVANEDAYLVDPYMIHEIFDGLQFQMCREKRYNKVHARAFRWESFTKNFLHLIFLHGHERKTPEGN